MSPLNLARDARNTLIGFVDDVCHFSYHHPLLALASVGTLPVSYGVYAWGYHLISYLTARCSELISLSHRYATTILETTHEPTIKPLSSWSFNPLNYLPLTWRPGYYWALWTTPLFQGYELRLPDAHPCKGSGLLSTSVRPVNLLAQAIFQGTDITINTPFQNNLISWILGRSAKLKFNSSFDKILQFIKDKAALVPDETVSVCAEGLSGSVNGVSFSDLTEIYGHDSFELSRKEISDIAHSQRIYTSRHLPLPFYTELALALQRDGHTQLPAIDLRDIRSIHARLLLRRVSRDPDEYGFQGLDHFNKFCKLSLSQIGSMVVKSQRYHPMLDGFGKILARSSNSNDKLQLIDISPIKDAAQNTLSDDCKRALMRETFKASLAACRSGIALFPAIGMESTSGNPSIYWRALLDAVRSSHLQLDWIGINPEHPPTLHDPHKNATGQEFQTILDEYIQDAKKAGDWHGFFNLRKITNFYGQRRDLVQLARSLKSSFSGKQVSIVSSSDPDITLGGCVGGELNVVQRSCMATTENFTAMGTNLLNFHELSQVHTNPDRLFQV